MATFERPPVIGLRGRAPSGCHLRLYDRPDGRTVAPATRGAERAQRIACRLMADKITTVPKSKIGARIGRLDDEDILYLNRAALVFLGLAVSTRSNKKAQSVNGPLKMCSPTRNCLAPQILSKGKRRRYPNDE